MELLKPTIQNHGPAADHNMPCPVCQNELAVLDLNTNIFQPCWTCQKTHTTIEPKRTLIQKIAHWYKQE